MLAIECHDIVKEYGKVTALKGISLSVAEGELLGLLGVNGAGKTTLIKILSTLSNATSGEALIYGFNVRTDEAEVKKITDVSPQETSIAPNLTVQENLNFFAKVYGLSKEESSKRIDEIVQAFHMEEVLNKRAKTLSGGWQRKLSLAIAIVSSPKLLFLDEPTLGLDPLARRELWNVITQLKGRMTIVLTSHYLEEIEALCDHIVIMSKGEILSEGTVEEIKEKASKDKFEDAFVEIIERSGASALM